MKPASPTPGERGRFRDFNVIDQSDHWDTVTKGVVLRRLGPPAPLRFFTEAEGAIARCLFDQLLGQHEEPRIDVLADVDSRLALEMTDGWHYADLPPDDQAWRVTLAHLDNDANSRFGESFATLEREQQAAIVQGVQDLVSAKKAWHDLPAERVWSLWTRYACTSFYSHPWAWNEIGFGGPAYPRGYKNIGLDAREKWERPEHDAKDPVPWAQRTEVARREHLDGLGPTS